MISRIRALSPLYILMLAMVLLQPTHARSQDAQPPTAPSQEEKRIALVVGNAAYQDGALSTTANDAGLIAQTLQAAGFDVVGARDLDQDSLRHAFRDFIDKAAQSGPDTVAFVYLAGYGVQLEGQNYFVPVDARLATPASIPAEAVRLSDFVQPLAGLRLKASVVVVDAARANKFAQGDQPLAGGLALTDATPNSLIAFNAAPGTVAPQEQGSYGAYARSLVESMRVGGLPVADVFERARLRVNEQTQGAMLPWSVSRISQPFVFFDRGEGAPPPQATYYQDKAMQSRKIADFDAGDAYSAALARDTLPAYQEFVAAYPSDPMAKRVRAIIAARREAITWKESWSRDTPNAYWSYLRRYPRGPHAWDARRRLEYLSAALEPPPAFDAIDYDVAPPEEDEIVYVDRPVFIFNDPDFDLLPPPPPPVIFLPPRPRDFIGLEPPPAPRDPYLLPSPPFVAIPDWVRPPRYVRPPPGNFIFDNIHDARIVNERLANPGQNRLPQGQPRPGRLPGGQGAPGSQMGGQPDGLGVALPPSLRPRLGRTLQRAPALNGQPALDGQQPGQPARRLPGMNGQPLPQGGPLPGQPQQGRKRLPGQQPGAVTPGNEQPSTAPGGQTRQPRQGRKSLPDALPPTDQQPGLAGAGQPKPGRKSLPGQQPGSPLPGGAAIPGQTVPAQQRPGRKRLPAQQFGNGQDQGAQPAPIPGNRRLRPPSQFNNGAGDNPAPAAPRRQRIQPQMQPEGAPLIQPRLNRQQPQPQMQPRQAPQMRMRPPVQERMPAVRPQPRLQRPPPQGAPAAPGGRRCGRPGMPACQ